jgi:RES domain-containing protein
LGESVKWFQTRWLAKQAQKITKMPQRSSSDRLAHAMKRCATCVGPWGGDLFRISSPRYANKDDLLTGVGSKTAGARWNPPDSFRTIYTSLEPETALAEVLAYFRYYHFPISTAMPRVIVSFEARLQRVLDLTDGTTRRLLGVSVRRLLDEPWRKLQEEGREALTQTIGRLAYNEGVEGLLVPSAARKEGMNLIIFPSHVEAQKSWLKIINKEELSPPLVD